MDALSTVLASFRLAGSVFSRAELSAPWGVSTAGIRDRGIFHAVVDGAAWLRVDGAAPVDHPLARGDVVVLPFGHAHTLRDDVTRRAVPLRSLPVRRDAAVDTLVSEGQGPTTRIVCGSFHLERSDVHPLLGSLPSVLVLRPFGDDAAWVQATVQLLEHESGHARPGADITLSRLAEILLVQAIRAHLEQQADLPQGWLKALTDPRVARALAALHREPAGAWTAISLARAAGMSRTAFYGRFVELVGEAPARYVVRWRVHVGARLLVEEGASVAEVARRVGYLSESAFARAFKRLYGRPPGAWQKTAASGRPADAGAEPKKETAR